MAKFRVMYIHSRPGLDQVIEADTYRATAKFFEFIVDKEVVRTLKLDIVIQIRRMEEDEEDDEEDDPALSTEAVLYDLVRQDTAALDDLVASLPGDKELDDLVASLPGDKELDDLVASLARRR